MVERLEKGRAGCQSMQLSALEGSAIVDTAIRMEPDDVRDCSPEPRDGSGAPICGRPSVFARGGWRAADPDLARATPKVETSSTVIPLKIAVAGMSTRFATPEPRGGDCRRIRAVVIL